MRTQRSRKCYDVLVNRRIQASLEQILLKTEDSWYQAMNDKLELNSNYIYERMVAIPELHPIKSRGAMYLLVRQCTSLYQYRDHAIYFMMLCCKLLN